MSSDRTTTSASALDNQGRVNWDQSYRLVKSSALWPDEPAPFARSTAELLRMQSVNCLLEVPCGDGKNTACLAAATSFVVAADSSVTALQLAKRRTVAKEVHNCVFMSTDAFATQFLDDQFDAIFCCDLLGHIENSTAVLTELVRICKPGGLIIGNVFGLEDSTRDVERMERLKNEEYLYAGAFYFRFYSEEEARDLVGAQPVEILKVESVKWVEGPHEGYREYSHEHQSWVFWLKKR